jgi:hypothetical protein
MRSLMKECKCIEAKMEPVWSSQQNGNSQRLGPESSMRRRNRRWQAKLAESPVELTLENTYSVNLGHCGSWIDWRAKGSHWTTFGIDV